MFRSATSPSSHCHFREFLRLLDKLNLNDAIMEQFAEIRSSLHRQGQIISHFDILLGATALHHDLTVLTRNTRHLLRISGVKIYQSA